MRKGYWLSSNGEIALIRMEDLHIKNVLRTLRKNLLLIKNPNLPIYSTTEDKLVELAEEAQRRNILPRSDLTIAQVMTYILTWENEYQVNKQKINTQPITRAVTLSYTNNGSNHRTEPSDFTKLAEYPEKNKINSAKKLYFNINVVDEISRITGLKTSKTQRVEIEFERRLDID